MTLDIAMWAFLRLQELGVTYLKIPQTATASSRGFLQVKIDARTLQPFRSFSGDSHDGRWKIPGGYNHRRSRR